MRTTLLGILLLGSLSLFATPTQTLNNDITPTCWGGAAMDSCFHAGDWWHEVTSFLPSGPITTLNCGMTAGCATCVQNFAGKWICGYGVKMNAACSCHNKQVPGAGRGITTCETSGNCTYRTEP